MFNFVETLFLNYIICHCCSPTDEAVYSKLSDQSRGQLKVMHSQELRILDFYIKLNHPDKPDLCTAVLDLIRGKVKVVRCLYNPPGCVKGVVWLKSKL